MEYPGTRNPLGIIAHTVYNFNIATHHKNSWQPLSSFILKKKKNPDVLRHIEMFMTSGR